MKNNKIAEKPLLQNAFEVLLKNLGPSKTTRVWQILSAPKTEYLKIKHKLFDRKSLNGLLRESKKFSR